MIVVTGATGNVGRPLVRALIELGEEVTAVSRSTLGPGAAAGVRHFRADLAEPESLQPVLERAEALFLLMSGDSGAAGRRLGDTLDIIRTSGVQRIVLLSSQGVSTGNHPSDPEDAVTQSGLGWTILRPGNFQSNALQWADTVRTDRLVMAPFGDVALPAIDPADIAEVAAVTLRDAAHDGHVYELTGPVAITPRQQASAIGHALGESVRFLEHSRAEAKTSMLRFMAEPVAERTLDILGAPSPVMQRVSPDVATLLGRPARPFDEWVTRNAEAFA